MIKADIFENGEILVYNNTVADSVMHEKISFNFPDCWSGYTKTAVFRNGDITLSVILNGDSDLCTGADECYIPHEVINFPEFTVSVFSVLGDSRATTPQAAIRVIKSGYGEGDEPSDPTPTVYEQLINITSETKKLADETKQIAQSVRDDADNGVLKGEKGDKGDTGAQGIQGEKGEKGDTGAQGIQGEKGDKGDTGAQGIQGEKGEKGDKGEDGYTPQKGTDYFTAEDIAGLNIPSVDMIFDCASENAQSGKAVAEAVEPKLDKPTAAPQSGDILKVTSVNEDGTFTCEWADAGGCDNDKFELIEEITTTEEISEFVRTQEPNGTEYNFSEIFLAITGITSTINQFWGYVDDSTVHTAYAYRSDIIKSGAIMNVHYFPRKAPICETSISITKANGAIENSIISPMIRDYHIDKSNYKKIMFRCEVATGSTIKIYGVRGV